MSQVPHDPALDSTLALARDGYTFIWSRCQRYDSDIFVTRLLGERTVCIHGREAARLFYDESRFERRGAVPRRVVTSLFGKGGVQGLDGEAHRQRKVAFLSLMTQGNLQRLLDLMAQEWRRAIRSWEGMPQPIVLFDEALLLLTRAACRWAGVPLERHEERQRARDFAAMVDAFGGLGPRLWRGKLARARAEHWISGIIELTRGGKLEPRAGQALRVMAELNGADGRLLSAKTAAVELINVLRPTAAIAWYVCFAALTLHEHPGLRQVLESDAAYLEGGSAEQVMHEIRRFYPFTPFLGAKVKAPFGWSGYQFEPGTLVLLDVYGTNHDPRLWDAPDRFVPSRFADERAGDAAFIPQGGGPALGHRCAGEWLTRHSLELALHFLTRGLSYNLVPGQELGFDLRRMPTRPESGVLLQSAVATRALAEPAPSLALPRSA